MYTWILCTGWWKGRAPINPDAVVIVGLLCTCLMGGVCVHQQVMAFFGAYHYAQTIWCNPDTEIRFGSLQSSKLLVITL